MHELLTGTDADGNVRDGILALDERGRFVHITLRLPKAAAQGLSSFLQAAYAAEPVLTIQVVRQLLAAEASRLSALGVTWIAAYGSVARGEATAASDVDLAYRLDHDPSFHDWVAISEAFEQILGKVVDAHRVIGDEYPIGAVNVWPAV